MRRHQQLMHRAGLFSNFARRTAIYSARPITFMLAFATIVIWGVSGPMFGYSDTWQLVINTGTTIVTFLMVFLIQNTQNRDSQAMQLKLDELIRSTKGAHTALLDLEELSDDELHRISKSYLEIAGQGREALRKGKSDTGCPEVERDGSNPLAPGSPEESPCSQWSQSPPTPCPEATSARRR